ncbi:MAG: hypothetical protein ABI585_03555 [Betaproteobacteria bacterium]
MTPAVVLGIVLLVVYWAWIGYFFARVRPGIMNALGRRLRVKVEESTSLLDAGTYGVTGENAALGKSGAVSVVDLVVLLLGTAGVAALLFVPAFIVADSGALLPIEARLTGRGAVLRVFDAVTMSSSDARAKVDLDVQNTGRETLQRCVAGVDGYSARSGYLHGSSDRFDLATAERRPVSLVVEATRPPAGTHRVRFKLECANERFAVVDAVLEVR